MNKDRNFRIVAIVALCLAVAGLSIGYAALNQTLDIKNKTTIKGTKWLVKFQENTLSTPNITGSAAVVNDATLSNTEVTVDVSLTKPGDAIYYTFDVKNVGNIKAKLGSDPTLPDLTDATAKHVTYSLTYADGSEIKANDVLDVGASKTIKLLVEYDSDATEVQTSDQVLTLNAQLYYVQF